MIPILFETTETAFTSNGLGRLADATRCEVTEERNGQYELALDYPVAGKMASALQCGRYIYATHDESKTPQAFQIYKVSTPLEGVITVNAWHISYALNAIIVAPFTAGSCTAAIAGVKTNSMNTNPFTFWTDKSVTADFATTIPMSARAILGGTQGSILDVYGAAEYEFDMYTVKLHQHRGQNRNVSIRYGKNLTKLDQELDASNVYNACVPYWTDGTNTVVSDAIITRTGETTGRTVSMDLSQDFETQPTLAELKAKAQTKIDASANYTLKENLKIDFVALWQTEEYKSMASLQRIFLCDTVNIFYAKLGINVTAKCIKVVYDSLRERYSAMELGEPTTSLLQEIQEQVVGDVLETVPSMSKIENAIQHATELIGGGFGGYIKFNYLPDGTPSEMLIMDSPSESTAVNIIRLNQNGLGFSTDGGSTYANAWTIDGNLNATFITTGVLDADLMTAGMIQDTSGENYWNLDSGQFVTKQGTIADYTIETDKLSNGSIAVGGTGSQLSPKNLILVGYTLIDSTGGVQTFATRYTKASSDGIEFQQAIAGIDSTFKSAGYIRPKYDVPNSDYTMEVGFGSSRKVLTLRDPNDIGTVGYAFYVWDRAGFYKLVYFQNGLQSGGDIKITSAGTQKFLADTSGNIKATGNAEIDGNFAVGMTPESGLASFNIPIKEYMGEAPVLYTSSANINSLSALNSTILSEFNSMSTYSVKRIIVNLQATFAPFTGAITEFEIYKSTAGYGSVVGRSYSANVAGAEEWRASIYSSAITGWMKSSTAIAITGTAASGVTINNNSSYKIGNLVVINLRLTLTAAKNMDAAIITGFPAPVSSLSSVGVIACACNRTDAAFAIMTDGTLATATSATARMYLISASYITA
jgi:phage minor structural protein